MSTSAVLDQTGEGNRVATDGDLERLVAFELQPAVVARGFQFLFRTVGNVDQTFPFELLGTFLL